MKLIEILLYIVGALLGLFILGNLIYAAVWFFSWGAWYVGIPVILIIIAIILLEVYSYES